MNSYTENQSSISYKNIELDSSFSHSHLSESNVVYRRSRSEVLLINLLIPTLSLISVAICLLPRMGFLPNWLVFTLNIILTTHIVALTHELIHEPKSSTAWNWLLRLNLHLYSPATLGFDELRRLHLLHHFHADTPLDPDYFLIQGGRLRSFFTLAFAPEFWFFSALRRHEIQSRFWILQIIRIFVFLLFVMAVGLENYFLLFYIPSKISFAIGFLIFSYESHTDLEGKHDRTYNLKARFPSIHSLLKVLIGSYAYHIAFDHASHHKFPWVSGKKLGLISELNCDLPERPFFY